jgi:membrane protease YdiL (CAAX protease family)
VSGEYEPHPTVPPPANPPAGWVPRDRRAPAEPTATEPAEPAATTGPVEPAATTGLPIGDGGGVPPTALRLKVELLVMLFATAVPGLVLGLRGFTDPERIDTDIAVLDLIAAFFAALGPAAVAVYLLWRDGRLSVAGFDRRPVREVAGYGLLGGVCAVLALWSGAVVLTVLYAIVGADPAEPGSSDVTLTVGTVVAAILIAVAAGVGEEIVYRAYSITRLEELGWVRTAIWAPWAVFTVQHLYQGPEAIVLIGAVAGTFVWLYRWQRSVWPVIVAHVLYDLFVLLLVATIG